VKQLLRQHFFGPVDAIRPWLLPRLFLLLFAVDIWVNFVGRSGRYGLGGLNVAHFGWLDALQPLPSPQLYASLMLIVSFLAAVVAIAGINRWLMGIICLLFTWGWAMSQIDSYQHHYLISVLLLTLVFFPQLRSSDLWPDNNVKAKSTAKQSAMAPVCAWAYALFGTQVAIVYLWTAIAKLDLLWLRGFTVREIVLSDAQLAAARASEEIHIFWPLMAIGAIVVELLLSAGYLTTPWRDRLVGRAMRWLWIAALAAAFSLHVGIEIMPLSIGLFSYYMMAVACVCLLPATWLRRAAGAVVRPLRRARTAAEVLVATTATPTRIAAAVVVIAVAFVVLAGISGLPGAAIGAAAAVVTVGGIVAAALCQRAEAGRRYVAATAVAAVFTLAAIHLSPARQQVYFALARDQHLRGHDREAMALYRVAERYKPLLSGHAPGLCVNYGELLQTFGQTDRALVWYRRALAKAPAMLAAQINLADALLAAGKAREAVAALHEAIRMQPTEARLYYNLGFAYHQLGETDSASSAYRRALALDNDLLEAHSNLAVLLIGDKKFVEAVAHLQDVLRLDPTHVMAMNNLAMIHMSSPDPALRDLPRAVELAEEAARRSDRKNPTVLGTLARAYARLGEREKAAQIAREVEQLTQASQRPH